jgi:hypothetical protein
MFGANSILWHFTQKLTDIKTLELKIEGIRDYILDKLIARSRSWDQSRSVDRRLPIIAVFVKYEPSIS